MISKARHRLSKFTLRKMIEDAIVDCYNEDEQHEAFLVMMEDHLQCPLPALVIGEKVTVLGFERKDYHGEILARCRRGRRIYNINVTAVEWPGRPPRGSEWIEAYLAWRKGDW